MTCHAYLFEAHSIQRYILDSGRLAEMIGASALVESLTADLLDEALAELRLEIDRDLRLTRRAGAAITALFDDPDKGREKAESLRDLWGLLVSQYAPGLAFSHTVVQGTDDYDAVEVKGCRAMRALKSHPSPSHPPAGAVARRSPRTGFPASDYGPEQGEGEGNKTREWVDRASFMKSRPRFRKSCDLTDKFAAPRDCRWPILVDADQEVEGDEVSIPFLPDNRYVGIVHADGNAMGEQLKLLKDVAQQDRARYAVLMREFSRSIQEATQCAAATATRTVVAPNAHKETKALPARPVVLGGDDLTMIVRGDLALDFAATFMEEFERETAKQLAEIKAHFGIENLPAYLSACAGIAFVKSSQPFYLAYRLADSMCDHAKKDCRAAGTLGEAPDASGKTIPSGLVFGRVTTSFIDAYPRMLDEQLTAVHSRPGGDGTSSRQDMRYRLTLMTYGVGAVRKGLPRLSDLKDLKDFLSSEDMARGPTRHLLTLVHGDTDQAERAYGRWRENLLEYGRDRRHGREALRDRFDSLLRALAGQDPRDALFFTPLGRDHQATPLGDVVAWMAIENAGAGESRAPEQEDHADA